MGPIRDDPTSDTPPVPCRDSRMTSGAWIETVSGNGPTTDWDGNSAGR